MISGAAATQVLDHVVADLYPERGGSGQRRCTLEVHLRVPALESARVQAKLKEVNGVLLIADNTKYPPVIATELEKYGRAGVPMVLVFPKDISKPAIVIPESALPGTVADNVIKALEDGAK